MTNISNGCCPKCDGWPGWNPLRNTYCKKPDCECHAPSKATVEGKCCTKCINDSPDGYWCDNEKCKCHSAAPDTIEKLKSFITRVVEGQKKKSKIDEVEAYIIGKQEGSQAMKEKVIAIAKDMRKILWSDDVNQHIRNIERENVLGELIKSLHEI